MKQKPSNIPSSNINNGGNGGKKSNNNMAMMIGIAIVVLVVLILCINLMKPSGQKKPQDNAQQVETIKGSNAGVAGAGKTQNYDRPKNTINRSAPNELLEKAANSDELVYYKDPSTQIEYVVTPTGPIIADSLEGRKYIEDFENNKKSKSTAEAPKADALIKSEIDSVRTTMNDQVRALDEKVNDLYAQLEDLTELTKKQNEALLKVSSQVSSIQPVIKSSHDIAKEIFGKNTKKELESRNNSIKVDSIVGDKAYFTSLDGVVSLLSVGDIVPGTTSKVVSIDPVSNRVIVAD